MFILFLVNFYRLLFVVCAIFCDAFGNWLSGCFLWRLAVYRDFLLICKLYFRVRLGWTRRRWWWNLWRTTVKSSIESHTNTSTLSSTSSRKTRFPSPSHRTRHPASCSPRSIPSRTTATSTCWAYCVCATEFPFLTIRSTSLKRGSWAARFDPFFLITLYNLSLEEVHDFVL